MPSLRLIHILDAILVCSQRCQCIKLSDFTIFLCDKVEFVLIDAAICLHVWKVVIRSCFGLIMCFSRSVSFLSCIISYVSGQSFNWMLVLFLPVWFCHYFCIKSLDDINCTKLSYSIQSFYAITAFKCLRYSVVALKLPLSTFGLFPRLIEMKCPVPMCVCFTVRHSYPLVWLALIFAN